MYHKLKCPQELHQERQRQQTFSHNDIWTFRKSETEDSSDRKKVLNPFPHNDAFWRLWETGLSKTLWEKEKLLIMSNFSFSHSVFYLFG